MSAPTCSKVLRGARRECRAVLDMSTDGLGRLITSCQKCERTARGLCRDCPNAVAGRALWCAGGRRIRGRAANARHLAEPTNRRRRNAVARKRLRRPEVQARKREQRRAWVKANPEKVKRQKRREALLQSPARRAREARNNADPVRQQKKRDHALRRYYELHPERPTTPICLACAQPITEWVPGRGARPKYHLAHSPWKHQRVRPVTAGASA